MMNDNKTEKHMNAVNKTKQAFSHLSLKHVSYGYWVFYDA